MQIVSTALLSKNVLQLIANTVAEHLLVCNLKEIAFVVNDVLASNNVPLIDEKEFVKYLKGKQEKGIIPSPEWELLDRLIIRETINRKKDLMETYLTTSDWKELKRMEFLFTNRFLNFGKEDVEEQKGFEGAGVIINIDARKIEISPITSESQMLEEGDDMINNYLVQRGLREA